MLLYLKKYSVSNGSHDSMKIAKGIFEVNDICSLFAGPKDNTVSEFWRMLWEQNVPIIVMVTNVMEGGRVREINGMKKLQKIPCLYNYNNMTINAI